MPIAFPIMKQLVWAVRPTQFQYIVESFIILSYRLGMVCLLFWSRDTTGLYNAEINFGD